MSRRQRFLIGLIVLLLAPLVVLLAFGVYVHLANAKPQTGELQTRVSPEVVLPWGEATYYIDFAGSKPTPTPAPNPTATPSPTPVPQPPLLDMVFIVDESSSMTNSIGEMAKAAQTVVQDLAKERPGRIRYAAIRFDVTAETQTDWTDKPDQLAQGLSAIAQAPKGGGTDGRVAFTKLEELLATARPKADKVVIFYTDGQIAGPGSAEAATITEAARKLREDKQVDFYSVGVPYQGSDPIMIEVTGDPNRVFDPLNPAELARMFQGVKNDVASANGSGTNVGTGPGNPQPRVSSGQLSHRLDGRHFATPLEGTNWTLANGAINLPIQPVPEDPTTYAHPLVPLSAGLWNVGIAPPRMVFYDKAGLKHQIAAQRLPMLVKVTYFTLLWMLLPALLWALAHAWRPRKRTADVAAQVENLPDILPPTLPEPLPLLPRLSLERLPPVPTLFVGLGGAGRRALHALRADLKQAHLGGAGEPYRFLWIDTDTQEEKRVLPFEGWADYQIDELIAPPAIRQTADYLPGSQGGSDHLRWFNSHPYSNAPLPVLNLSDGAKGERALARLALFRWLAAPSGILPQLVERVKQLALFPAADGTRQIVIVAAADGGVGSGWFLDFGRLFQRIARQNKDQGLDMLPDVIGILCEDRQSRHPENQRALALELETALTVRRFPQRVIYAPGETLLDEVDEQNPYHWVFSVAAGDNNSVAAQCGELAAVLVERHPRAGLLDQAQNIRPDTAVATTSYAAHVLPTLIYDQVTCELFLRLIGPDILLDVVPDAQGGLKPQPAAADWVGQLLDEWSRVEVGSPLQLLLRAAIDPAAVAGFVTRMQATAPGPQAWFSGAFAAAVTQQLQGHSAGASGWERGWKPGEAVATLRLLVGRLERSLKPDLLTRNAPAQATEAVDHVIRLADSTANELEQWVQDFCRECERVAAQRNHLELARRQLLDLRPRVYLDLEVKPEQIELWARAGLEAWLGTPDTVSAIRRRLFFAITAADVRVSTSVKSYIAKEPRCFVSAEEAAAEIEQLARTLALNVPAARIGGVLMTISDERRRNLARELVRTESQPQQVLVVLPQATGLTREEQQAIEEFGNSIPKPPTHGPRVQQRGDDHSAVRRLELSEPVAGQPSAPSQPLTFVEMAESVAEAVRRRAEKKYQIAIPIFPPRLRIALAQPAAFRSFARSYKAGHILKRDDDSGNEQWSVVDSGQFLTFGRESSLAHAAANYVRDVKNHPESFVVAGAGGDFGKLAQWRDQRVTADADTLTQIAVDVYE